MSYPSPPNLKIGNSFATIRDRMEKSMELRKQKMRKEQRAALVIGKIIGKKMMERKLQRNKNMRERKVNMLLDKYSGYEKDDFKRLDLQDMLATNLATANKLGKKLKGYNKDELIKFQTKLDMLLKRLQELKVKKTYQLCSL